MRGVRDRLRCCFAEALPSDIPCRFVRDSNDEDKRIGQTARSREGLRRGMKGLIYDLRLSTHKSPITIHKGVYRISAEKPPTFPGTKLPKIPLQISLSL